MWGQWVRQFKDLRASEWDSDTSSGDEFQQDFPRNFNSGPGLTDHPPTRPYFKNQLETIKAPQEIDNTDAAKIIRHTQRRKAWSEYWVGASRKVPSPHHHHLPPPAVHSFHQKCRPPQSAAPGHFSPPPPFSGPWLAPDTLRSELPSADVDDAAENSDTIFTAPGGTEWLQITHGDFVVWTSCYCPLLGCTRSRGRCWAAIRLSQCFLSRFWVSPWHPQILKWHLKFWKPRYGFALSWSKMIWDKHAFLHVAIATDGCNVIGRHNFLAQKLKTKIASLVSVHSHAHCFTSAYCRWFVQYGRTIARKSSIGGFTLVREGFTFVQRGLDIQIWQKVH